MTCSYCGTDLPSGAMFCGECGRSTGARPASPHLDRAGSGASAASLPGNIGATDLHNLGSQSEPVVESERGPDAEPRPALVFAPALVFEPKLVLEPELGIVLGPEIIDLTGEDVVCTQCGQRFEESDIFCPECGFVRSGPASPEGPNDTVAYDPFPWGLSRSTERSSAPLSTVPPNSEVVTEAPEWAHPRPLAAIPANLEAASSIGSALRETAAFSESDFVDEEKTRILSRSPRGERFVLQFSTGESVTVFGTGMVGRHPVSEPGEFFDTFVTIVDPGKSVSKTHLEFGQDGGHFWVSDRFSGNGTVAREPDSQPTRCDPGKRYRIVRGTRVNIGEQFFIVS